MSYFIYMEDLAANALIENIDRNQTRKVRFSDLKKYGESLTRWWLKNRGVAVTVLISKYYVSELMRNYSEFFEIKNEESGGFICLRSGKTVEDLRITFRSYLSMDMLAGFIQAYILEFEED